MYFLLDENDSTVLDAGVFYERPADAIDKMRGLAVDPLTGRVFAARGVIESKMIGGMDGESRECAGWSYIYLIIMNIF